MYKFRLNIIKTIYDSVSTVSGKNRKWVQCEISHRSYLSFVLSKMVLPRSIEMPLVTTNNIDMELQFNNLRSVFAIYPELWYSRYVVNKDFWNHYHDLHFITILSIYFPAQVVLSIAELNGIAECCQCSRFKTNLNFFLFVFCAKNLIYGTIK